MCLQKWQADSTAGRDRKRSASIEGSKFLFRTFYLFRRYHYQERYQDTIPRTDTDTRNAMDEGMTDLSILEDIQTQVSALTDSNSSLKQSLQSIRNAVIDLLDDLNHIRTDMAGMKKSNEDLYGSLKLTDKPFGDTTEKAEQHQLEAKMGTLDKKFDHMMVLMMALLVVVSIPAILAVLFRM